MSKGETKNINTCTDNVRRNCCIFAVLVLCTALMQRTCVWFASFGCGAKRMRLQITKFVSNFGRFRNSRHGKVLHSSVLLSSTNPIRPAMNLDTHTSTRAIRLPNQRQGVDSGLLPSDATWYFKASVYTALQPRRLKQQRACPIQIDWNCQPTEKLALGVSNSRRNFFRLSVRTGHNPLLYYNNKLEPQIEQHCFVVVQTCHNPQTESVAMLRLQTNPWKCSNTFQRPHKFPFVSRSCFLLTLQ